MTKRFGLILLAVSLLASCRNNNGDTLMPRGKVSTEWAAAAEAFIAETDSVQAPDIAKTNSIMIVHHGKVVFEQYYDGFTPDSTLDVYSVSKTLLALAVGCAADEGLLSVDDRVIDYFPDKLPENVSDTLSALKISHLLTMTCGLEETPKLLAAFSGKDDFDWLEEFFNSRQAHMPGTSFYYNFFSPYIVSAILEKVTGLGVVDYITPRLLEPLHITDLVWKDSPAGICVGGWGLSVCTEDMAKIGQLIIQHGKWNGRQLVPAEWVGTMTSNLVASKPLSAFTYRMDPKMLEDPENDHSQGYGYYVWQGKSGTYRAEGLKGRHIIISPSKETVFAITSNSNMDQRYFDLIWKHFGNLIY